MGYTPEKRESLDQKEPKQKRTKSIRISTFKLHTLVYDCDSSWERKKSGDDDDDGDPGYRYRSFSSLLRPSRGPNDVARKCSTPEKPSRKRKRFP